MDDSATHLLEEDVAEKYPEVTHYTNAVGLHGILTSQTIWATHANFLNDLDEVSLFFKNRLEELCSQAYSAVFESQDKSELRQDSKKMTQEIMGHTLDFNLPFFFSLTSSDTDLVKKDGLLSQWRAYGSDGGYALVFKTSDLIELMHEESKKYMYQFFQIGNVHYFDGLIKNSDTPIAPEVLNAERKVVNCLSGYLRSRAPESFGEMYDSISFLSCMYKSIHFNEEKELRMVAIPAVDPELFSEGGVKKPIKTFPRNGCMIPYIEIFGPEPDEKSDKKLPIKKIIVGPHNEKLIRRKALDIWLKNLDLNDVEIVVSDISYKG